MRLVLTLSLLATLLSGAAPVRSPVHDADFPDPMVLRGEDGWYYAYATGTRDGRFQSNISVSRSRDLQSWSTPSDALPVKPRWAASKHKFWAPHVVQVGDRYVMYYSAEPDWSESEHMRLAVATSKSPLGPFTDMGKEMDTGDAEENLDPAPFTDPKSGKRYLYWGRNGVIAVQELDLNQTQFAPGSQPVELLHASERPYEKIVEGPFVVYRSGWYFMFYSGDDCCGNPPHYAVMAARSKSPLGPFVKLADGAKKASSVILEADTRYLGPGHNAVVTDGQGRDWIVYHAVDAKQRTVKETGNIRRPLMIERLVYEGGWPKVLRRPN